MLGSKNNKAKLSKEEIKAKKLADAEAKKAAKAQKAAEAKADREADMADKKVAKRNKQDSKMQQEKSQLAKDLDIRISSPYGYYPDDVDPIITRLQNDVATLTKENKQLRDEVGALSDKNKSLSTELTALKLQISITDIPVSMEDSMSNLSMLGNINGNEYDDSLDDLAQSLLNDDDTPPVSKPFKPKFKLKNGNGGNT